MISSGIKRGVAASAISALAVAGLPFFAGTANAAPGDNFTVAYTGPALNSGDEGALVIIRAQVGEITPANLKAVGTSGTTTGTEDNADQDVEVLSASAPVEDEADEDFEFIEVRVAVTTADTGDAATFRLFEDDGDDTDTDTTNDTNDTLDADEARQPVSISTAGPLASIDVSPATQSSPEGIESGAYTVTIKDSAGRTTQLLEADALTVTPEGTVTVNETDGTISSDEIVRGTDTFTATGTTAGSFDIDVTDTLTPAIDDTAVLNVTEAAELTAEEINIVTDADSWNGFGNDPDSDGDNGTTLVRVDQNTVRFDFDAANSEAGANVQLSAVGDGVTFAGQDEATYTTTLDGNGNGSITVTVDAATIQDVDSFDVDINGFLQTIEFDRATAASIDGESTTYFCQDDADCTVTAVVKDQFGNPVTTGEVEARRTGHNVDLTPQRKPVGSDGTVDFTFTDSNPVDGGTDTVTFEYFVDQFDTTPETGMSGSTTIKYSATGQGSDYRISLDTENTEAPGYEASDATVIPLTDTDADTVDGAFDEDATIDIAGGEAGQAVTLSVDNGALIVGPDDSATESDLIEGSASVDATLNDSGALPDGYRVIGTQSGLVTLTVDSAGRTETAQLLVADQDDEWTARNVTVSGPAEVESGTTQIQYTAVITDAFGNPVSGVSVAQLNVQVTGPAVFQDSDAVSNDAGQINLNVRVDSDAEGVVTIRVQGLPFGTQFGADEDRLTSGSATDNGEGLPESMDVATASTTVAGPVVDDERKAINPKLRGKNNGAKADRLTVKGPVRAAGAVVDLFKINKNNKRVFLKTKTLNREGDIKFKVGDKNGRKVTTYKAVVKRTVDTKKASTNRKDVR